MRPAVLASSTSRSTNARCVERRIKVSSATADGGESQVSMNLSQVIGQNNEIITANSLLTGASFPPECSFPAKTSAKLAAAIRHLFGRRRRSLPILLMETGSSGMSNDECFLQREIRSPLQADGKRLEVRREGGIDKRKNAMSQSGAELGVYAVVFRGTFCRAKRPPPSPPSPLACLRGPRR